MNTTCCSNGARPDPYALADFNYTKFQRASVDVQASAGISLVTADGDKVTLNASSSLKASLQTYDCLGRTRGQTVAARDEKFQLSTSSGYALTVEGTLDEEELADIEGLLNTLSAVSQDFVAGKSQNGLKHLTQLDDLDSITSFEASFVYSRRITAVAARQISASAEAEGNPEANPAAAITAAQPVDSFIDQLRRVAEQLDADNSLEKIPQRFTRLFKNLAHQLALDAHDEKLAERIRTEHLRHRRHGDGQTQQLI